MANIRKNIESSIGTRLYFEGHGIYEIDGHFPLEVGEVLSIHEQEHNAFMMGYSAESWEPLKGHRYKVEKIDPPVLYRYNHYNPNEGTEHHRGNHNALRLSRKVTLRKIVEDFSEDHD